MALLAPYVYDRPVSDASLLAMRGYAIELSLEVCCSDSSPSEHILLMGEHHSGRTSTLHEIARRAAEERARIVVRLRPSNAQLSEAGFIRHLLLASTEAVAGAVGKADAAWYEAWRSRVYLQSQHAVDRSDRLSSGLLYAANPDASIDPLIVEHDLALLRDEAIKSGAKGILVTLDDVADITEDTALIEHVVATFDAVGGWSLILAGLPVSARHFREAASPCVRRFVPISLRPFRESEVLTCLQVPLAGTESLKRVKSDDPDLARDLVRLTGGNPFEIMLVAHHMWVACELGENEYFALTPRVLDRVVRELALHTTSGEALFDAARAIRRLDEGQVPTAIELVACSRLTIREIAVLRALRLNQRPPASLRLDASEDDVAEAHDDVLRELADLHDAGVIDLSPEDDGFTVRGGRPVSVLLKYEAQAGESKHAPNRPFGLSFLRSAGRSLIRHAFSEAADMLPRAVKLGVGVTELDATTPRIGSARRVVAGLNSAESLAGIVKADFNVISVNGIESFERTQEIIGGDGSVAIALVSASVSNQAELEYIEMWEIDTETTQADISAALPRAFDEVMGALDLADLKWRGAETVVLTSDRARSALVLLLPFAADTTLKKAFVRYYQDRQKNSLLNSIELADRVSAAIREHEPPMLSKVIWSITLSKCGFLKSFDDGRLDEASSDLRDAMEYGTADGWITAWNLANVLARQSCYDEALELLDEIAAAIDDYDSTAYILFWVPGAQTVETLLDVDHEALGAIFEMQRKVVAWQAGKCSTDSIRDLCDDDELERPECVVAAVRLLQRAISARSGTADPDAPVVGEPSARRSDGAG